MKQYTDEEFRSFLDALDAAWREIRITDWEVNFLESNTERKTFTEAQRSSIIRMILKYGNDIEW